MYQIKIVMAGPEGRGKGWSFGATETASMDDATVKAVRRHTFREAVRWAAKETQNKVRFTHHGKRSIMSVDALLGDILWLREDGSAMLRILEKDGIRR